MRLPENPLGRVVSAAANGPDLARRASALLPRTVDLLDAADRLVTRLEALLDRLELREAEIHAVVQQVAATHATARTVIARLDETSVRVQTLVEIYEPVLAHSAETAAYAGDRFGNEQVDALIALLGHESTMRDIKALLPALAALETVAPDLKELLAVSRGLNELMGSVPGMGKAKRRVDNELEELRQEADDPRSPRA